MSNRILAIAAALAVVALILWLVVPDRRTVPSLANNELQDGASLDFAAAPLSIESMAASAPALMPPTRARPEAVSVAESRRDVSPITLSDGDRSLALWLARLDDRDFEQVVSSINTEERLYALRDQVPKLISRDGKARGPAFRLATPIASQKLRAGQYASYAQEPEPTRLDGVRVCFSGGDPTTEGAFKVVTVDRGVDPALDAALDKRDADFAQIRIAARALMDAWR